MSYLSLSCIDPAREEAEHVDGNVEALLALIEEWKSEPGDYDERVGPELDRLLAEDPVRMGVPDVGEEDALPF